MLPVAGLTQTGTPASVPALTRCVWPLSTSRTSLSRMTPPKRSGSVV